MGVRGLPIEFATDASKSVRLETGAKLAKTQFEPTPAPSAAGAVLELTPDRGEGPYPVRVNDIETHVFKSLTSNWV